MVHINAATLRKYPILGVAIGLASAGFIVFLMQSGWAEARALLAQRSPVSLTLHEAVNQTGVRWVTIADGEWHCDDAVTIPQRGFVANLLWGHVESVEVPITSGSPDELLVARFEKAVSCPERANARLTGVIGSVEIFTSRATKSRWRRAARGVTVLNVDASPRGALGLLLGIGAVLVFMILFSGYYLRLMFRSGEGGRTITPMSQPMSRPIEPS